MAVKKVAIKKAVAKKVVAKKVAPAKKVVAKKVVAKKVTPAKKVVAKKVVAKKVVAKKVTPTKKVVAKKVTPAKKVVAKKVVAKTAAPAKKVVAKTAALVVTSENFDMAAVPTLSLPRSPRLETISAVASSTTKDSPVALPVAKKPAASSRVVFAVVVGIVLLLAIVWSRSHATPLAATPSPTAVASTTPSISSAPTATASPSASSSPSATSSALADHQPPRGVVAQYNKNGATIFWKAPAIVTGVTGYNVEISLSNGDWKLISTLPATQLSLDVIKKSGEGWSSFLVSTLYSDGKITSAKAFGLPGSYA